MSEVFEFGTGNDKIDGRIVHYYSYNNTNQSYSVTCDVQFRRNNTSYANPTSGTIKYTLYLYYGNSSTSQYGETGFTIPNNAGVDLDKRWTSLITYTFRDISLERFNTSFYKVGFASSTTTNGPSAFKIPLVKSTSYTVGPYSTNVREPQNLTILSDGNNFKIRCIVGANGENNASQGVKIYYTTDGTDPNTSTSTHKTITGSAGSTVYTDNIPITWDTTIKTIAYTIPEYNDAVYTSSSVVSRSVVYSPVFSWDDKAFTLSCVTNKRPTPRESYQVTMPTLTGPDGLTYKKQIVIKNQNEKILYSSDIIDGDESILIIPKNTFKDLLQPDDEIIAYLTPIVYKGDSFKKGESKSSNTLTILTPSNVKININGGTSWVDGQPYVYDNGWKESTGVFIHNGEGWKESI